MRTFAPAALLAALVAGAACGARTPPADRPGAPAAASANAPAPRVVFLGDSLTAGLGLDAANSFPSLVQVRLNERGYRYEVINAGVSGDTSAGGLRRLAWSLDGDVRVVVVALGANDGLRGLPVDQLRANLTAIIEGARARGVTVILAGMEAPPNYGAEYADRFRAVYADLAREHTLRFIPFLLDGVAGIASLNQADGIHPNAQGARRVADLVWDALEPALERPTPVAR